MNSSEKKYYDSVSGKNTEPAQIILETINHIDNAQNMAAMKEAISYTLAVIGEHTGADRVFIFDRLDDNSDIYTNSYEWCAEGVTPQIDNLLHMTEEEMPYWIDKFVDGNMIIIENLEEVRDVMPSEYEILKVQSIKSEIAVPIFYKGNLSGFIGLDNPPGQPTLFVQLLSLVGTHIGIARANVKMMSLLTQKQNELEEKIERIKSENDMLMVLCADNASVYRIDLENDVAEVVKMEVYTNASLFLSPQQRKTLKYSDAITAYFRDYVVSGSAPDFLERLDRKNLMKELSKTDRISMRFMSVPNKIGQVYFEVTVARIHSSDKGFYALMDFRHVDEIVKEEHERREKLESALKLAKFNNDIIFAISKIYFLIYRIDLTSDYFEEISSGNAEHRLTGKKGKASFELKSMGNSYVTSKYRDKTTAFFDYSTLKQRMKNDESIGMEYLAVDGNWHMARFIVQERDKNGEAVQLLFVIRLITEEKQREKSWMIAAEEANKANEAKSDFLSRMSHDIRTPMNVIMGFVNIARQHLDDKDKLSDCLDKIKYSGENLQNLIDDVLDLSKIESGNFELNNEPSDINEMFDFYKQSAQGAGIGRKLYYNFNLHDIEHNIISTDSVRLGQIIINLLSNAVKYTLDGGTVSLEMYEEHTQREGYTRLVTIVSDTGIGMDEEFIGKMYDEFSRAVDTRVNKVRGSGLGLAIVKKLVDLMGGTIEVNSRVQEGTAFRFTVELPYLSDEYRLSSNEETIDETVGKGLNLLIAEDNELNYEILSEQLMMRGITCDHAENGRECVDMFVDSGNDYYDAILMDMQMPVMDGLTAAWNIRHSKVPYARDIPIIAVTANAYSDDVKKCIGAGMNGHVSKPVNVDKLLRMIVEMEKK